MTDIVTVSFSRTEDDRGFHACITARFKGGNESRLICDHYYPTAGPTTPERYKLEQLGQCRVDEPTTLAQFHIMELRFRKALESKAALVKLFEEMCPAGEPNGMRLHIIKESEVVFQPSAMAARIARPDAIISFIKDHSMDAEAHLIKVIREDFSDHSFEDLMRLFREATKKE